MEEDAIIKFQKEVEKWKEKLRKAMTKEERERAEDKLREIGRKYGFLILTPEGRKAMEEIAKALVENAKKTIDLAKKLIKER